MTPLLKAEGVEAFYGASQILHGIDLTVRQGDQIALVGRNGMGKTTLLRSLIGLVKDRRGRIVLNGVDVTKSSAEDIARSGVALVPEGRGIFASLSVTENLIMASKAAASGRRDWTLERVFSLFPRLKERRRNGGQELSGGEQQMLAIGRALMTNPDLMLIDEATEGLAPLVAEQIWSTLKELGGERIAAIIVDRDFKKLSQIAGSVIVLSAGRVVFSGAPADLISQPEILDKYLGV